MSNKKHPKHERILAMAADGKGAHAISRALDIPRRTVRNIVARSKKAVNLQEKDTSKDIRREITDPLSNTFEVIGIQDPEKHKEIFEKLVKGGLPRDEMPLSLVNEMEANGYTFLLNKGRIELLRTPGLLEGRIEPPMNIFDVKREWHHFGVLSDTHFGGFQAQPWFVRQFLQEASRREVSAIFHVGDHVDGPPAMHKGMEYELGLSRADDQVDFTADVYLTSTVPMFGITGNHDGSYFKASGINIGRMLQTATKGLYTDLGPIQAWVGGPNGDPHFMRLFHPGDGCSYALSYKDQKTMEYLAISEKDPPSGFHFTGHYHKHNIQPGPKGSRYILVPASCGVTPFMMAKRLINRSGAFFISFTLNKLGEVDRCIVEDVIMEPTQWVRCDYSGNAWKKESPFKQKMRW